MSTALRPLVRAELLRTRTLPSTAALVGLLALAVVAFVALGVGGSDVSSLRGDAGARTILSVGGAAAYPVAFVLGVLGSAGEFRHGTIVRSVLASPRRWPVVLAKAGVHGALGAVAGLIGFALALLVAGPWMSGRGAALDLGSGLPWQIGVGSVVASALFGVLGVAVGVLVRNQYAALLGGLAWIFVIDYATVAATSEGGRLLPGGAALSLVQAGGGQRLSSGAATAVLVLYAALLTGAAMVVIVRRRRLP